MQRFVYLDAFADAGETQAMLLYKEVATDYLLIDDKRGRKVAKINQIKTVGSLGVLLQAKRAGLIPRNTPLIAQIAASPVFMGESLILIVLELAGESLARGSKQAVQARVLERVANAPNGDRISVFLHLNQEPLLSRKYVARQGRSSVHIDRVVKKGNNNQHAYR